MGKKIQKGFSLRHALTGVVIMQYISECSYLSTEPQEDVSYIYFTCKVILFYKQLEIYLTFSIEKEIE